jgi:hypothetical protein
MQNHGLTMCESTCYIERVPRVHPGLLCGVRIFKCVSSHARALEKYVSEFALCFGNFLAEMLLRCLSSLCERICRAS